ncbi:MAG TPA: hypothetical protein VFJ71_07915 [Candidatus Limnocylindrales bacterium]|nr:hypothetical protein [Candidatus Limnocylindrales bacterium]
MADALETVLRLVAEGRLTAEQAAPLLDALGEDEGGSRDGGPSAATSEPPTEPASAPRGSASALRIEVTDKGRKVVNLRIPIPLGRMALDRIPGLAGNHVDMVRQALADGRTGTLLVLDDDGDGVRIALE